MPNAYTLHISPKNVHHPINAGKRTNNFPGNTISFWSARGTSPYQEPARQDYAYRLVQEMTKTVTTAQYRKMAREAEKRLDWKNALEYWKKALEVYPEIPGELADRDRDQIITAINADQSMVPNA